MKAWKVTDLCDQYSTIVFAESRNKARLEAMYTDVCDDMEYLEINPRRAKWADELCRGRREVDWYEDEDRILMVQHGWCCDDADTDECRACPAKNWCSNYDPGYYEEG